MLKNIFNSETVHRLNDVYQHGGYGELHFELNDILKSCIDDKSKKFIKKLIIACNIRIETAGKVSKIITPVTQNPNPGYFLSCFSSEDLRDFKEFYENINLPCINVLLLNILFEENKDYKLALDLIENYEDLIFNPHDFFINGDSHMKRYFYLFKRYNKKKINVLEENITQIIETHRPKDYVYCIELSKLLREYNLTNHGTRIQNAFDAASKHFCKNGDAFEGKMMAQEAVNWYHLTGDDEKIADATIRLADTYELLISELPPTGQFIYLKIVIDLLEQIPNKIKIIKNIPARISALKKELEASRKELPNFMQEVRTKTRDLQHYSISYEKQLKNCKKESIIEQFAELFHFSYSTGLCQAIAYTKNPGISSLFDATVINNYFQRIATIPSSEYSAPINENNKVVQFHLSYSFLENAAIRGIIIEKIIHEENHFGIEEIITFIHRIIINNNYIKQNRKRLFIKGMLMCLKGDYLAGMHILAPQIEQLVRGILQAKEETTITTDKQLNENEIGLSSLSERDNFRASFGKLLTFEIRELFCEKYGPNIRNEIAHGLIGQDDLNLVYYPYAWWLILCILHRLNNKNME